MNIELLELAAAALDDLLPSVVFVGGATVELWISDPAAPPVRATQDVDVVVEITTRPDLHRFEEQLRARQLKEDTESGVICRWLKPGTGLVLDVIPADASIIGFSNQWQAAALPHAQEHRLPSGTVIRAITPPYLLATKLEAFASRGRGDYHGSRDFGDIVTIVNGRAELAAELDASDAELQSFVAERAAAFMNDPSFVDGTYGALLPDDASQDRAELVVVPFFERRAGR